MTAPALSGLAPRLARSKFLRSKIAAPLFEANQRLWPLLPQALVESAPLGAYGRFLHYLACLRQERKQSDWTCFLRNRAEIRLHRRAWARRTRWGNPVGRSAWLQHRR